MSNTKTGAWVSVEWSAGDVSCALVLSRRHKDPSRVWVRPAGAMGLSSPRVVLRSAVRPFHDAPEALQRDCMRYA